MTARVGLSPYSPDTRRTKLLGDPGVRMPDASALLGTWKMASWQRESVATGERSDALGPDPVGFITYGADGRMFAIVIQKDRDPPAGPVPTDDEKLRLFNS